MISETRLCVLTLKGSGQQANDDNYDSVKSRICSAFRLCSGQVFELVEP